MPQNLTSLFAVTPSPLLQSWVWWRREGNKIPRPRTQHNIVNGGGGGDARLYRKSEVKFRDKVRVQMRMSPATSHYGPDLRRGARRELRVTACLNL